MKQHQQANTLVIVLVIVTALMTFVAAAMQFTQGIGRHAHRARTTVTAEAIGDGCFDLIFASWRQICQRSAQPVMSAGALWTNELIATPYLYYVSKDSPPATNAFANIPLPTASMFPNVSGFSVTRGPMTAANETISNYMVQAVDPRITLTTTDPPLSNFPPTQLPPTEGPDGSDGGQMYGDRSWYYLASADITLPTPAGPVTRKMRRVFEKKIRKPGNYFMFFNDDLELHPNSTAPLTLYGRIHTNGTLYTGTSSLTLNATIPALTTGLYSGFTGEVRTQGVSYGENWVRGFKPGDPNHLGAPAAPTITASPSPQPSPQRVPKEFLYGILPTDFNATDGNTNNDDWHELLELPTASTPDPFSRQTGANYNSAYNCGTPPFLTPSTYGTASPRRAIDRFPTRAGLIIEISATNVVTIKNKCGETLVSTTSTSPAPSKGPENLTDPNNLGYWPYAWAVDMWMTALGVPSTNLNGANVGKIGRTSGAVGSTTLSSKTIRTTGTFFLNGPPDSAKSPSSDIGMYVTGTGIPAYTTITAVPSTTVTAAGTLGSNKTITVASTASWTATSGIVLRLINSAGVIQTPITCTGKGAPGLTFTGCTGGSGSTAIGNVVTGASEATMSAAATSTNASVAFTVTPITTITDPREASPVELITLDFNVFKWWDPHAPFVYGPDPNNPDVRRLQIFYGVTGAAGNLPNVFIQVAQGATKKAIRIKNGASGQQKNHELAPGIVPTPTPVPSKVPLHALTTDAPLYIQGDLFSYSSQTIAIGKTINSPNITSAGLFTAAMVGLPISGTGPAPNYGTNGIPPFTTILSVTNASNAVMSQNATNATAVSIDLPNTAVSPPSNTTAGPRTSVWNVTTTNGAGGSIITADSVTVLSNNWQDKNSALPLTSRIASNTTINARIVTGDVPTTSSAYSGGGENLLRLLEDWTGKYFTFSGTLHQYYHSKVATGTWGKAAVYIEPTPSGSPLAGGRFWYPEPGFSTDINTNIWSGVVSYSKNAWTPVPIP